MSGSLYEGRTVDVVYFDFSKGGQLAEREPVMCPCSKGGQQHPDLPQEMY